MELGMLHVKNVAVSKTFDFIFPETSDVEA